MIIYLVIFAVLVFLIIKHDINKEKVGYKFSYILMLSILICVSGLRYKIGSDTLSYMDEYKYLPDLKQLFKANQFDERYDFLWIVFCAICKSVSNSFFFMQFIHALIINSIYFYFIYKHTNYRFTAIFFYFLLGFLYFNTEILRESMAVAIFLMAISFFYRRKWLYYYLTVPFAVLFHTSALIVLIFPLFSRIKFNRFFLISLVVVAISGGLIWAIFNENIQVFFIISSIEAKSKSYLNNELYIYNFNGMLYGIITYTIIPLLGVFFYKRHIKTTPIEVPFIWLYIAIGIFIVYNNTIFTRFQNYLFFPFILFLSELFNEIYRNRKKILFHPVKVMILFFLLSFGRYYNYFKTDITETTYIYDRYFPYHSILTKETTPERELLDYYW